VTQPDPKLILITLLVELGVAAAFSSSLARSKTFKDLLLKRDRTPRETVGLLAMICIPMTLGVWIRVSVPNFLAADLSFETTILLGVLMGPLAAMAATTSSFRLSARIEEKEMELRAIDALTYVSTATDDPRALDETKAKEEAAANAKKRVAKMPLQQKQLIFLGSKLIAHYGCMNCHAINGMENAASPCANLSDWGQKQVSKLDFAYLDEHKIHSLPPKRAIPMVNGLSPGRAKLARHPVQQLGGCAVSEFDLELAKPSRDA